MTRLFIRFYLGVLIVLFLAWYIHGWVSDSRARADRARVVTAAHGGGARLVAEELSAAKSPEDRDRILAELRERFDYRLQIISIEELPQPARQTIEGGEDIAYDRDTVVAVLAGGDELVRLGSFPNYSRQQIEASLAGWMRITKDRFDAVGAEQWPQVVNQLQGQFEIPVRLDLLVTLPESPRKRVAAYEDNVAFYSPDNKRWYSAILLDGEGQHIVCFGPFANFEDIDQKAAATTLALVLLPAALAIALLLRPMALQLRQLENAAEAIASGDLSARVDQQRMKSAKQLAQAFNHMAGRTEALVRTQRELLQAVSHELRTPLARMRFAIDLIGTATTEEERSQRLESLDAATEELDGLVGELLSYVRMETTDPKHEPEFVALQETLSILVPKFSALFPNVEFEENEIATSDALVWTDRRGFQRVLGNLVSNAGRHAKRRVSIHCATINGSTIIDVDDDGNGIAEADRQRVFEPFVRLESGADKGGVGLGLALVKRIVTQNGGTVEVLEGPLGGCRIRTKWPRKPKPS